IDIEHPINLVESETQVNFTSSNEDPTTTNIIRGHYTAKCRYCLKFWTRGIPDKLEAHLALKCEKVDRETSQIYLKKLAIKNSVSDIESEDKMSIKIARITIKLNKLVKSERNMTLGNENI
ncbi:11331_t:CDS:2, partial [Entrophospora sp. SA101]